MVVSGQLVDRWLRWVELDAERNGGQPDSGWNDFCDEGAWRGDAVKACGVALLVGGEAVPLAEVQVVEPGQVEALASTSGTVPVASVQAVGDPFVVSVPPSPRAPGEPSDVPALRREVGTLKSRLGLEEYEASELRRLDREQGRE